MKIRRLVMISLLAGMSYVLMFTLQIPLIPAAPYLKFDPSDLPNLVGAFLLGPWAAIQIAFVKAALFLFTKGTSGPVGSIMNFLSSAVFVGVAGYVYKKRPGVVSAVAGMFLGGIAMTLAMIPVNYYWALSAYGIPKELQMGLIKTALTPFNLARGTLSTAMTLPLFLALLRTLKKRGYGLLA